MYILQLNIQSLNKNIDHLNYYINNNNIDICILSEIFEFNNPRIRNFQIIAKSRPDNYGGVALAFRNSIKFRRIKFDTEYDIIIAKTKNLKPNLVIASVYLPPSINSTA